MFALPLFSRHPRAYTWLSPRESWHRVRKRPVTERAIAQRPNGFIADCMVMLFFTFFPLDSGRSMVYITR